jgi:hypothetical protein
MMRVRVDYDRAPASDLTPLTFSSSLTHLIVKLVLSLDFEKSSEK